MTDTSLLSRLDYITSSLVELEEILNEYDKRSKGKGRRMAYYAAERKAEEIVESAIALNQGLLFSRFDHVSRSYKMSFIELEKFEVFTEKEIDLLAETAHFRNRLAHDYIHANEEETVAQMREILHLYPNYVRKIKKAVFKVR